MVPVLFTAFLLVPLAEIYVILQVGHVLGFWLTLALLLGGSVLGAALVKHEGMRAWRTLKAALAAGRIPGREMADAGLVLAGGVLLLTPGFLTDAVGFVLVLPFTRPLARRVLTFLALRRVLPLGTTRLRRGTGARGGAGPGASGSGIVIEGETLPPRSPGTTTRPPSAPR